MSVNCVAQGTRQAEELHRLVQASRHAARIGIEVHAGHGLHYHNVLPVAAIPEVVELNIGHSIIVRAVMVGLPTAVADMKRPLREAHVIHGVGTDVVQVSRMEAVWQRHGEKFARRTLMPQELVW